MSSHGDWRLEPQEATRASICSLGTEQGAGTQHTTAAAPAPTNWLRFGLRLRPIRFPEMWIADGLIWEIKWACIARRVRAGGGGNFYSSKEGRVRL